ncbi:MAG: nitrogen fixation protein NifH [Anaerolineales bacterium]
MENEIPERIQRWLLDPEDPGARYLALNSLYPGPVPNRDEELRAAHQSGAIKEIMKAMHPDGYWVNDGPGYLPKYRSSAWSLILLSQLGARCEADPRIELACRHYLDQSYSPGGQISTNGTPSGTVDCLQGNILAALKALNYRDERLDPAYEWMARTTTGEGIAPQTARDAPDRYYAGKCGPDFQCGANNKLACAWGAVKVLLAFSKLASQERTPLIDRAIKRGVDFIFSADPKDAAYPNGWNPKPSGNWWKFGYPVFYVTDILQICEVLSDLGFGDDPRLINALRLVEEKANPDGSWSLEYHYQGKTWSDFGPSKSPNKYVTIRAYHALGRKLSLDASLS